MVGVERLPIPYVSLVAGGTLLALAEQVVEYSLQDRTFRHVGAGAITQALVFVFLFPYILLSWRILKRETVKGLATLRPVVQIGDQEYDDHVRRLLQADGRLELALLALSIAVVLVVLVAPPSELLHPPGGAPPPWPAVAFVLLTYVLLGWLLLTLVYTSIRYARGLGALAHRPLVVNVFDPTCLLPFGRLSLLHSLSVAGVMLIPLVFLGAPTRGGYVVMLLSLASVLVLFVPLWGAHQQMARAKAQVLASVCDYLMEVQEELLEHSEKDAKKLKALADRASALRNLHKAIEEAPSWPFKNEAAVARAVIAALSPLVYFILNQVVAAYVLPIFQP